MSKLKRILVTSFAVIEVIAFSQFCLPPHFQN
jgi:hypothetical protein